MKNLIFMLLLWPMLSIAQVPKPMPDTYINDLSHTLSADQVRNLNIQIRTIETAQNVQIAVVLVHALPDNLSIEEYAMQIGRTWHVGNARRGLVYVAAIDQHKQRLEVGTGLEGTITDIQAKELTDNIKAFFRAQHYFEGVSTMLTSINTILKTETHFDNAPVQKTSGDNWLITVMILLGFGGIIYVIHRAIYKHRREVLEAAAEKETAVYDPYDRAYVRSFDSSGLPARVVKDTRRRPSSNDITVIAPVIINEEPTRSYSSSSDSGSSGSESSSSSSSSSDYGSWGSSDSSSSSSSDSFSGGGSSNDW